MRIFNLVLAVMFLIFAFVQVNDPDPLIWILIYGLMAATCVLAAFNVYLPKALAVLGVILVAYGISYYPGVSEWLSRDNKSLLFDDIAKMEYPYIEESREFLGLLICVAVLVMHLIRWKRLQR
ncbi:MAG TPA: transmembrane 220 family protein [Cyclobacteriaceae bacterium]|nr:transmembrane 220 family protein [Cyclobacteriaceae bacterium]